MKSRVKFLSVQNMSRAWFTPHCFPHINLQNQHWPPHIDLLFLELCIPFSLTQDSIPVSEYYDVICSNAVDGSVFCSPPGKQRRRPIYCSWFDHNFLCKEDGWPHRQDQVLTKSWRNCVITSSCDALGTFSQKLTL